ncbi:DUF2277 domain-containing protein [Hyalangium rubrum]|uniref:DUF2277 domain-containing protein n=1 Tax=Hyalangium rubrum TaxID=3103134 RepID=A0ABU5GZ25_9BACT|nr:DUF2277 domain-containing protein [Hyalangium sp. s54d21]MDY7226306.1 DUF2277 domain-containing protein [Hyalangium sp. s54d21]
MCRNIKLLHHFEPPASKEEIRDSALQYVRKLSGMRAPSRANQAAFDRAVDEVTATITRLFASLESHGPPRTREAEKLKAIDRGLKREAQVRARVLQNMSRQR